MKTAIHSQQVDASHGGVKEMKDGWPKHLERVPLPMSILGTSAGGADVICERKAVVFRQGVDNCDRLIVLPRYGLHSA